MSLVKRFMTNSMASFLIFKGGDTMKQQTIRHFDPSTISNLQDLKRQFKDLIKKHHPDLGGSTAIMAEINNEYEHLFVTVQSHSTTSKDKYNVVDDAFREILAKIVHLPDLNIEICGTWIWVSGQTRKYKEHFKVIGLHYAPAKKMWYWHSPTEPSRRRQGTWDISRIREAYGSSEVSTTPLHAMN
jgi:hypothetical protein